MRAVLLCSGLATRMRGRIKPLVKVGGREILYRTITLLRTHGIDEFVIVVNRKNKEAIEEFLQRIGVNYRLVVNDSPERGNGYSLYLARNHVSGRFVLAMGDHVFGEDFVREALKGEGLVCDGEPRYVSLDEATKVVVEDGRVRDIGKHLKDFCCVDTGFFVLDDSIFDHAEELVREREAVELSEIVKRAGLKIHRVDGRLWMDVDTPDDVRRAEKALFSLAVKGEDGFISKHINRKISTRISRMLVNRISPNHATLLSFLVGVISSLSVLVSIPLAGLIYQLSSILDGVDGEIARVAMKTLKIGGWVDSILDRVVDFLFLSILAYATLRTPQEFFVAMLAIFGSFMVSYVAEKYRADFGESIYRKIRVRVPGKRDERVFLVMVFCLLYPYLPTVYLFALLALITFGRVGEMVVKAARKN
ncbi:putative sugar nucleotidyltransferase [Geoglobus ahangari]|uniref:Bifunctional IPC transferase and DIPP synthase n=1 Tax=Geoglobus ahangari TaxID=113653 RepID=A0A0F7DBR0_9EURY|nr:bifunctional L-myo-inositol-1-phosphate cytidylyltransferase/CDP-L-myo-inositol myo-inositolphosphotransferase [Geoglobus ahangari]AKG91526.1 putative sugar nucleotidyltransferase [Geoglobus ahangari]